jgi:hypothetical protein
MIESKPGQHNLPHSRHDDVHEARFDECNESQDDEGGDQGSRHDTKHRQAQGMQRTFAHLL